MRRYFIICFALVGLLLSGCSTEAAEKVITTFHTKIDTGEHAYIYENMLDKDAQASTNRETWMAIFRELDTGEGVKNRQQQSGFSKSTKNGVTTTRLNYTFDKDGTTYYERIVVIDRGDGGEGKILTYVYNSDEEKANEFVKAF